VSCTTCLILAGTQTTFYGPVQYLSVYSQLAKNVLLTARISLRELFRKQSRRQRA
jgi:hypothetical protein